MLNLGQVQRELRGIKCCWIRYYEIVHLSLVSRPTVLPSETQKIGKNVIFFIYIGVKGEKNDSSELKVFVDSISEYLCGCIKCSGGSLPNTSLE